MTTHKKVSVDPLSDPLSDQYNHQRDGSTVDNSQSRNSDPIFWNDRKVKDALGYPVTRTIFDRNGDIILDVGDLITHDAVQRAKDADVLEQVFYAVYRGESSTNYDFI